MPAATDTVTLDGLTFDNTFARLPDAFHVRMEPTPVPQPELIRLNRALAEHLRLDPDALAAPDGLAVLAGNRVPTTAEPLAMVYAGHQFGNWVPRLGDGRAILLGEVVDRDGVRRDIQLKGAGLTPFSRMADGRAALGPVLREYLGSEAMAALGIPTTRALAMVATGQAVYRDRVEPGAILARVATSHVRVGSFEYFFHRGDHAAVRTLADYVIARHYPELADAENPYRALLDEVIRRNADLIANWLLVGFIHGVMNTDNVSIAGETIDYGPFGYVDTYHPATVYSSIDVQGRYAFNQQPRAAHWNLAQFAQTLVPLLADDEDTAIDQARSALDAFAPRFEATYHAGLRRKIGLASERDGDIDLAFDLLQRMARGQADFTLTFRRLSDVTADGGGDDGVRQLFDEPELFDAWAAQWRERLAGEARDDAERRTAMRAVNPAYILRNHLAQRAIDQALQARDFSVMEDLLTVLATPFADHPGMEAYAQPPGPGEAVTRTFCGT